MQRIPLMALIWLAMAMVPGSVSAQARTTGTLSNIGKTDSDQKLNAVRNVRADAEAEAGTPGANRAIQTPINMQVGVFEETETVLQLAPARQVNWARAYASQILRSDAGLQVDQAQIRAAVKAAFPDDPPGMHLQVHLILQMIMMGDIVGALQSYAVLKDRDMRQFTRQIVDKLDQVRKARSRVIREFAHGKPPRAYAGSNPSHAARAQDKSTRYTQFVQMNTQLMNELQHNTERELMDALGTQHRDLETLWESYAGMRDEDFRTSEKVMTTR